MTSTAVPPTYPTASAPGARRRRRPRRLLQLGALAGAASLVLTACGGGGGGGNGGGSGSQEFGVLINTENTTIPAVLQSLGEQQCKTQNDALPLKVETVPQTQLDQQVQLRAGQGALPLQFGAQNPDFMKQLAENGQIVDLEKALTDLGKIDQVQPAAISTVKALFGGLYELPYEYNIEGIWYNKQLFADNGIAVPGTWDELVAAAATLQAAGIQPFSASGEQGWPITRLIGGYLFRDLGPDALQKVADGQAKLTDPDYVAAAQQVADLGAEGYFGQGVGSIDYDTSFSTFLSGDAAMFYMGSWALTNFADETQNEIGSQNIGFMPFPAVAGGAGSIDQVPANVGLSLAVSQPLYGDEAGAWLGCIADNYGSTALQEQGSISGFKASADVPVDELTKSVQDTIASTQTSVLWFEALFNAKATTDSQTNASQLVTGAMSPADFMSLLQSDLDAG